MKAFDFPISSEANSGLSADGKPKHITCDFLDQKLPTHFVVYATGAYSGRKLGFQIDQSGHEATQFDLAVHQPEKPVALLLGAYEPTIWNIGWSEKTKIVAVFVSGYHRQAIAGLPKNVPVINSTYHNKAPCGTSYLSTDKLEGVNARSRSIFGKPVDMVFPPKNGFVVIGLAVDPKVKLLTSQDDSPESFQDKNAPLAGRPGVADAVAKGILRPATEADAALWASEVNKRMVPEEKDVPPVAGGAPKRRSGVPSLHEAYVVLKPFTYPAGLYGAHAVTFFISKGVPKPQGNPGHSSVYDFNSVICDGPMCRY